jgi:hypothetical protein
VKKSAFLASVIKDFQHLRWLILTIWILIISIPLSTITATEGFSTSALSMLSFLVSIAAMTACVQLDPATGTDNFLATRPISRSTLILSKITLFILCCLIPGVLAYIGIIPLHKIDSTVLERCLLGGMTALFLGVSTVSILLPAVLTRSFSRLIVILFCLFAAVMAYSLLNEPRDVILGSFQILSSQFVYHYQTQISPTLRCSRLSLALIVFIGISLWGILSYYGSRKWWVPFPFYIAGCILSFFVWTHWNYDFFSVLLRQSKPVNVVKKISFKESPQVIFRTSNKILSFYISKQIKVLKDSSVTKAAQANLSAYNEAEFIELSNSVDLNNIPERQFIGDTQVTTTGTFSDGYQVEFRDNIGSYERYIPLRCINELLPLKTPDLKEQNYVWKEFTNGTPFTQYGTTGWERSASISLFKCKASALSNRVHQVQLKGRIVGQILQPVILDSAPLTPVAILTAPHLRIKIKEISPQTLYIRFEQKRLILPWEDSFNFTATPRILIRDPESRDYLDAWSWPKNGNTIGPIGMVAFNIGLGKLNISSADHRINRIEWLSRAEIYLIGTEQVATGISDFEFPNVELSSLPNATKP